MKTKQLRMYLFDEDAEKVKWMYVCDIGAKLYNTFLRKMGIDEKQFSDYVADWFKVDFGFNFAMSTRRDLAILKGSVKERYKILYPSIYANTDITPEGWVRIWISEKMERELKNI